MNDTRVWRSAGRGELPPGRRGRSRGRGDLGRHTEHGFRDQQVVGEVEVLRQASAGKPLEDLAIAFHHGAQTFTKGLVLPLAIDVLRNRLPRSGRRNP